MKTNLSGWVWILLMLFLLSSCQDNYNICELSRDVRMKGGLYHVSAGTETVATAPSFTLSFLNSGSLTYNKASNISKFAINLNTLFDSSRYFIRVSDALQPDTLTVVYTTQDVLLSTECGTVLVNEIVRASVTNNTIDSVVVVNPTNNTTSGENIKIYF